VPAVPVVFYRVGYKLSSTNYYPPTSHRTQLIDWMRRAYPLNNLRVWLRSTYYGNGSVNASGDLTKPTCGKVNSKLLGKKIWDILSFSGVPLKARYYGMVSDVGGFMRGCAMDIPASVASGPTGTGSWGWDFDGSYGDWYGAHELGHAFGRGHANYCGAGGGPSYPYTGGRISPSLTGNTAIYGFDIHTRAIYGPNSKDLMSYCDDLWMSDFTYEGLLNYFRNTLSSATPSGVTPSSAGLYSERVTVDVMDRLLVSGTINATASTAELDTLWVIPDAGDVKPAEPGSYDLVLRDTSGAELARYPFSPTPLELGPAQPGTTPVDDEMYVIYELVPYVEGTAKVEVVDGDQILASVTAGVGMPTVQVLAPNGGEVLDGATIPVSWTASDPDGDALYYNVWYSADNGATWELIAQDLTETSVDIDEINAPASNQALFRVGASDGIHSAYDQSDASFIVPNRPPRATIVSPPNDTTVAISQTVALVADVYDVDSGTLSDEQLTWSSSLDGVLGQGESLSVATLSVGVHTLTLTADDGMGGVTAPTVQVTVVDDPGAVPAEDVLLATPGVIRFTLPQGARQAVLTVENANAGRAIAWSASADQAWIELETTSGTTPEEILVTYVDTGLGGGLHSGTITITSSDLPGQTVRVTVEAQVNDAGLWLPLVMRP
jgi:hypothetical protein